MNNLRNLMLSMCAVLCASACTFHDDSVKPKPDEFATPENIIGATYSCDQVTLKILDENEAECTLREYDLIPSVTADYNLDDADEDTPEFIFNYLWEEDMDDPTTALRYRIVFDGEFESLEELFVEEFYYSYRDGMDVLESYTLKNLTLKRQ